MTSSDGVHNEPIAQRPAPDGTSTGLGTAERYRTLVEQVEDYAIFMMDAEGRNATWNAGVERVLGYEEQAFLGLPAEHIFTPEDRARGEPEKELRTAREQGAASDDRWLLRRSGERFWASGVTTALRDEHGRHIGYSKVLRDLTAQKRAQDALAASEAALRATEDRLRVALSAAQIGTWRWDLAAGTCWIDASFEHLLGLAPEAPIRTIADFLAVVHPDDRASVAAAFDGAAHSDRGFGIEFRIVRADGAVRWLRDHGEVILDEDGAPRYVTGAAVDTTERRDAEERLRASQRMDAVGKLAGGVAHEVNNMMSVVLGFTELLLPEFAPGDRRRRDLEEVRAAAGRAAAVTAQLLAFSRRQLLRPEPLQVGDVLRSLARVLERMLGADKTLVLDLAADEPYVRADRGQIEQLTLNLVINARDAMTSGGVLTVSTARVGGAEVRPLDADPPATGAEFARLTVRDTGHGMDAATLGRIFEPFFTTKGVGQGTGLGLAVVYGIVRQSDGYIAAESQPGRGSSFCIWLPAVARDDEPSEPAPAPSFPRADATVLVVEDEPMVRQWLVRLLESLGCVCLQAEDGAAGLQLLEQRANPVDLVITDVVMPRMSGRELADELAGRYPGVPVLFISGYTDDEMVRRDLLRPGAPFMQKPLELDAFTARVRELLGQVPGPSAG